MKAIRICSLQMLGHMRRDMMLLAACLAPILAGAFFKLGIPLLEAELTNLLSLPAVLSPYYGLPDAFLAMLTPVMLCFASAMVALEEADENTAVSLFVTPLGKRGYLIARFALPCVASFLAALLLLPVFKLTRLSFTQIVLLAAAGAPVGLITALLIVTLSSNKLEGMAIAKLSSLIALAVIAPFFIKHDVQYVLALLPSFWIGKALSESASVYMLPSLAVSLVWSCVLFKCYLRKMHRAG